MAMTKKSTQDYWNASFGEIGQAKTGTNALEIGALDQSGLSFERLPIGTSSGGTAVKVDLIGAETFSVSVGTITTIQKGTQELLGTVGNLAKGTITTILAGTQELLGTVGNLAKGTVTRLEGGTLGILTAGTVTALGAGTITTQLAGTQELLGTAKYLGTVGVLNAGTITRLQGGTLGNLDSGSVVVTAATVGTVTAFPLISGEDQTNDVIKVEPQFSYSHYTIGSGTIKSAAGFLHAVTVNNAATCPVEIFDAIGTAEGTVASLKGSVAEGAYIYNVKCPTGITIASTTAAACDITVAYR